MCPIKFENVFWAMKNSSLSPKFHMTGIHQKSFEVHIRSGPAGFVSFRANMSRAKASEQFTDINHLS